MSWYISTRNSINRPKIEKSWMESTVKGNNEVCQSICGLIIKHNKIKKRPCIIAFDAFLGAEWKSVVEQIAELLNNQGLIVESINTNCLYKSLDWIEKYVKPYLTDDPSFGIVCNKGRLKDLLDSSSLKKLTHRMNKIKKKRFSAGSPAAVICYGIGSSIADLKSLYDLIFYFDLTRETLLRQIGENKVTPLGASEPGYIFWKRLYYVDYPILTKHKKYLLKHMDYYVDNNNLDELKLLPKAVYDGITSTLVKYPLKFKRVFMPGPWGGHRFSKYFNLPKLANCAWNIECSGPDLSLLVDVGIGNYLDIPFFNLYMQYPIEVIGHYCHKKYPGLFPIQVGIDDGYFSTPVPHERRAMPIHLHPDTHYVKKNFKEPLGRYEVYYIIKAYKGANTMHGFYEDADIEEFKKRVLEADEKGIKFDWTKHVKAWPSKQGELYLIPAGTVHGTGGNQMILEMDTCPSISGIEYSFFLYDYLRHTWDEATKTMTGKLVKLQLKHGLAQCRWYRKEKWVRKHIRPKPKIVRSGKGWSEEQFGSYSPMPYHIERLNFKTRIEADTLGRFFHFLCLTKGERALIRSKKDRQRQIELEYIQSTIIPAGFGKYECINTGNKPCTLTRQCWKRG